MNLAITLAGQYIYQAQKNWEFLSFAVNHHSIQYDWMITIQYYCILHVLKAHLIDQGIRAGFHSDLKREIGDPTAKFAKVMSDPFLTMKVNSRHPLYIHYGLLETYSRRARYLGIDGYYQPVTAQTLFATIRETDALLAHFLHHHPKISQAPFNALQTLPPIVFRLPAAWVSMSGLFAIN